MQVHPEGLTGNRGADGVGSIRSRAARSAAFSKTGTPKRAFRQVGRLEVGPVEDLAVKRGPLGTATARAGPDLRPRTDATCRVLT